MPVAGRRNINAETFERDNLVHDAAATHTQHNNTGSSYKIHINEKVAPVNYPFPKWRNQRKDRNCEYLMRTLLIANKALATVFDKRLISSADQVGPGHCLVSARVSQEMDLPAKRDPL